MMRVVEWCRLQSKYVSIPVVLRDFVFNNWICFRVLLGMSWAFRTCLGVWITRCLGKGSYGKVIGSPRIFGLAFWLWGSRIGARNDDWSCDNLSASKTCMAQYWLAQKEGLMCPYVMDGWFGTVRIRIPINHPDETIRMNHPVFWCCWFLEARSLPQSAPGLRWWKLNSAWRPITSVPRNFKLDPWQWDGYGWILVDEGWWGIMRDDENGAWHVQVSCLSAFTEASCRGRMSPVTKVLRCCCSPLGQRHGECYCTSASTYCT